MEYDPQKIEPKWQKKWEKSSLFKAEDKSKKPKFYCLDMFPYPSGAGLHVGHPRGYIATDIFYHFMQLKGYNVLHPMGWDAFGLPAENYAIKTGIHPEVSTEQNIERFRSQMKTIGLTYDWSREVNTTDPDYYKWTQWIFLKLFEKGLAYEAFLPINWCPSCKTGLANEEVVAGKCDRCGTQVIKKDVRQWVLKITAYAERLLEDLEGLDWPEKIIMMQKNWIGKSEGADVDFKIEGIDEKIKIFTTRPDTLFGATFMVLSPEHPLVDKITTEEKRSEVEKYKKQAREKSDLERTDLAKEKTGVFTGAFAVNPVNNEKIPIWIADYVLMSYGYGAIMSVPAHDQRDWDFAKKYGLETREVVAPYMKDDARDDKITEKRDVVTAIVKNSKDNTCLCLDWKTTSWKSFPTGGIDNQDPVVAAKREVEEETGYKNIKFIRQIGGPIYAEFFRPHKDSNVFANFKYLLFELENEEKSEVVQKEKDQHGFVWVPEKEVDSYLNVWNQKLMWKRYIEGEFAYVGEGININSDFINGLKTREAFQKMTKWLEDKNIGKKAVNYHLRDWGFSRQRYWGEPIPLVHCEKCGIVPLPEKELPLRLPKVKNYQPTGTGESPLADVPEWVNTKCPKCKGPAKRETNTMPQWAGSCWYFLRYADPNNGKALIDPEKSKYWLPVDLYVGGAEHAVLHLLYSRFWIKVLYDVGVISFKEPFLKLKNQGLIMAPDGQKMSKSRGNVINPDEIVKKYGADTLRFYEMFMGPFEDSIAWDTKGIEGCSRFFKRFWNFVISNLGAKEDSKESLQVLNRLIKKVGEDIENFKFNTAVSAFMGALNDLEKQKISKGSIEKILILVSPLAPHIAEELWEALGHKESVFSGKWPEYDKSFIKQETVNLIIQINSRIRDKMDVSSDMSKEEAERLTFQRANVIKWIQGKEVKKVIFIPGRLINIVI